VLRRKGLAMTLLGMPEVRVLNGRQSEGTVTFAGTSHHFTVAGAADVEGLAAAAIAPLSVILQVTKQCNFDCNFCSETLQLPDPTLAELDEIRANLAGVRRVFLSGGEPLLRRDFIDIVEMYSEFIIGVPTNATRGVRLPSSWPGRWRSSTWGSRDPAVPPSPS